LCERCLDCVQHVHKVHASSVALEHEISNTLHHCMSNIHPISSNINFQTTCSACCTLYIRAETVSPSPRLGLLTSVRLALGLLRVLSSSLDLLRSLCEQVFNCFFYSGLSGPDERCAGLCGTRGC
jgi:hypothetical protein